MSEVLREQAQFRKGKTPIIAKYSEEHAKLFTEVAGRGFLRLPGFVYDVENGIELSAKMMLSELNLKILTETIERELKQTGIEHDQNYKTALLQWEIDKQTLLNAWEVEYSGIKIASAREEEVLNRLAIEVSKRGTYLIEQKTIIELEAEALRTQLATLEGTTAPYEVTLANEKLLTAQKKLEIIPILQAIVVKEEELLEAERGKAAAYTELMAAEQEVVTKKETLVPVIAELTNVSEQYTGEFAQQIIMEGQIADEKVAQAGISRDNAEERNRTAAKEIERETILLEVDDKKKELSDAKNVNENTLLDKDIANIHELENAETGANARILSDEEAAQTYVLDEKRTSINYDNATKVASSGRVSDSEKSKIALIANSEADEIRQKAEIDAVAKITAQLTHLIG
jgi:hypothetical protein